VTGCGSFVVEVVKLQLSRWLGDRMLTTGQRAADKYFQMRLRAVSRIERAIEVQSAYEGSSVGRVGWRAGAVLLPLGCVE
jgi:hypothetical protein